VTDGSFDSASRFEHVCVVHDTRSRVLRVVPTTRRLRDFNAFGLEHDAGLTTFQSASRYVSEWDCRPGRRPN